MRLFTALDLPATVVNSLESLQTRLRPTAPIKWSPPANLHITTRFIGEFPDARLPELRAALAAIPTPAPIPIHVRSLGFFPNPHTPHTFWAGIDAPPALAALASSTNRALLPLGFPAEDRPFRPHLTLARINQPAALHELHAAIAALPPTDFGSFHAVAFYLYLSRPTPQGSLYTKLAEFPLSTCAILGQG